MDDPFCCPITCMPVEDGVVAITAAGQAYCPAAISRWLASSAKDPSTGVQMWTKALAVVPVDTHKPLADAIRRGAFPYMCVSGHPAIRGLSLRLLAGAMQVVRDQVFGADGTAPWVVEAVPGIASCMYHDSLVLSLLACEAVFADACRELALSVSVLDAVYEAHARNPNVVKAFVTGACRASATRREALLAAAAFVAGRVSRGDIGAGNAFLSCISGCKHLRPDAVEVWVPVFVACFWRERLVRNGLKAAAICAHKTPTTAWLPLVKPVQRKVLGGFRDSEGTLAHLFLFLESVIVQDRPQCLALATRIVPSLRAALAILVKRPSSDLLRAVLNLLRKLTAHADTHPVLRDVACAIAVAGKCTKRALAVLLNLCCCTDTSPQVMEASWGQSAAAVLGAYSGKSEDVVAAVCRAYVPTGVLDPAMDDTVLKAMAPHWRHTDVAAAAFRLIGTTRPPEETQALLGEFPVTMAISAHCADRAFLALALSVVRAACVNDGVLKRAGFWGLGDAVYDLFDHVDPEDLDVCIYTFQVMVMGSEFFSKVYDLPDYRMYA